MSENTISKEQIKKLAELAKLDVSGQASRLSETLSDTLNYVGTLNELDTSKTEETLQVTGLNNVFQENVIRKSLDKDDALFNGKEIINGLFSTEAVFNR